MQEEPWCVAVSYVHASLESLGVQARRWLRRQVPGAVQASGVRRRCASEQVARHQAVPQRQESLITSQDVRGSAAVQAGIDAGNINLQSAGVFFQARPGLQRLGIASYVLRHSQERQL